MFNSLLFSVVLYHLFTLDIHGQFVL